MSFLASATASIPMPGTAYRETTPGRILLVDGDYAAYYHSGKDDTHWTKGRDEFLDRLVQAKRTTGSDLIEVHLSDPMTNKGERFEVSVTKPYQGNRSGSEKPANWQHMRDFLSAGHPTFKVISWTDREADDGCAYVATEAAKRGMLHAVHYRDKDFRMFPGIHSDWTTLSTLEVPLGTFYKLGNNGKQFGHFWFWRQMLWGDSADHIPGCKGIGEKKSNDVLTGVRDNADAERVVVELYRSKYGPVWADVFVEQACLLWMRNDADASLLNFMQILSGSYEELDDASFRMEDRVAKLRVG
ncbi:exonuclease [Xanthomonas phage SB3]|uniref:Exonuclease n=1 Tax=Xanthomonas phage SB3 TaxID=3117472 RepID=A0ABZ2GZG8_9CAUD